VGVGFLTVAQILTQGCQQGGNPSLVNAPAGYTESLALTFLRSFLHHVYLNYDFGFMLKTAAITTGSGSDGTYSIDLTALTNYRASKGLKLYQVTNPLDFQQNWVSLNQQILADLDAAGSPPTGVPDTFAVKPDKTQIHVHPIPQQIYTGTLYYYKIFDVTSATLTTSSIPDFEDSMALVQAVELFTRNYDKDTLVNLSESIAVKLFSQYRVSQPDAGRVKPILVRPSPFHFKYQTGD
jgi:hypothetical protein